MPKDALVNVSATLERPIGPRQRVSEMQVKLHHWAAADTGRRFDDLFNLVHDPATLIVAFDRVATNLGARTAGVDGLTVADVERIMGAPSFLDDLRAHLREGTFGPLPVRERKIPKPGGSGKVRKLGIPTVADRVVQAALKLVLEPIFEADFEPVSYGFRPKRRAHDAIAEIHHFGTLGYRWVLDADIEACFDSIDHSALMDRVRHRVKDKRVLGLVKAFLKAGVLTELGENRDTHTGTPQGGILSPLLSNIALSVLDEHLQGQWRQQMGTESRRARRRRKGLGTWRLVRYADDCVTRTQGGLDVEGRTRRAVLCQRWRKVLRDRPAGGGLKPPQAASVKSRSGERCGKGALRVRQVRAEKASASEPLMTCRKRIDDIKTEGESFLRDQSGRNLSTAQVMSGIKAARAQLRLWYGTCEPVASIRRPESRLVACRSREGGPQAAGTARGRVPMRGTGADRPVVAVRPGSAGGAKGPDHLDVFGGQP